MIDIQINNDGCPEYAFILPNDLRTGKNIIYLGGDRAELNRDLKENLDDYTIADRAKDWLRTAHSPGDALILNEIAETISHESCHIAIYKVTESIWTTRQLDRIEQVGNRLLDDDHSLR